MNVSQIGSNPLVSLNIGGKSNGVQGNFASLLQSAMNGQESFNINPMGSSALPDLNQLNSISNLSDSGVKDALTSIQGNMQSNGMDISAIPDVSQMSDSEISSFKVHMQDSLDKMQNVMANGGITGVGNVSGSSEVNPMQIFLDALSSATSSGNEDEELFPKFQIPKVNSMSTADFLSIRQMAKSLA